MHVYEYFLCNYKKSLQLYYVKVLSWSLLSSNCRQDGFRQITLVLVLLWKDSFMINIQYMYSIGSFQTLNGGRRSRDRTVTVVGFTTTCAIKACHH